MNLSRYVSYGIVSSVAVWGAVNLSAEEHETKGAQTSSQSPQASSYSQSAQSKDASFIKEAAKGGKMEVTMGKLAEQKAQNAQVKQLGERLQQDHTKANQELMQIAQKSGVTLDHDKDAHSTSKTSGATATTREHATAQAGHADHSDKAQHELTQLQSKSGAEFDKAFIEHALKHHQKDILTFQQALQDTQNPELKAFIGKTLPVLRQHLEMARSAGRAVGVDQSALSAADQFLSDRSQGLGRAAGSETGTGSTTSPQNQNRQSGADSER